MKVKFLPSGEEHEIEVNETILNLAKRTGYHIQSVCKGIPSCAECRIQIKEGEHHVLPPNKKEIDLIGTAHYIDLSRLSCQLRCFGDVTVDLTEQIEKEKRAQDKPKDRMARSDGQESKAVLGGILDNVVAEDVDVEEERAEKVEKVKVEAFKGKPKLDKRDSFYGDFYNKKSKKKSKNKSKNQKNKKKNPNQKQAQGQKPDSQKADGGQKPKKKNNRNRNRNRNRNKNKQGAPQS
ncbi:MAG: 2Fe-2S iron-sulfur cluster binding domain-containing protein [Bdellovibrionales bacterium]|nr:2Fe-2S iron-sulfur cluster-binding protein [Bdellovibrionales bacterium]NQZ19427.1 2Fe-2S iron-sulfur cluster binding domain-containing protein [Bdellovibrionales bacterium]